MRASGELATTATLTRCAMCSMAPSKESRNAVHDGQASSISGPNMKL